MDFATRVPKLPQLRSSIASYVVISGARPVSKMIHPRPGATLVINLAGSYRIDGVCAPHAALFGLLERPARLEIDLAPIDRIQVQFAPCGLSRFTRVAAALDRFFADHYAPPTALEEAIDSLARRLCDDPDVDLRLLLREPPASLRHIERLFARLVGTSPRSFARIARFEQAKSRLLAKGGSGAFRARAGRAGRPHLQERQGGSSRRGCAHRAAGREGHGGAHGARRRGRNRASGRRDRGELRRGRRPGRQCGAVAHGAIRLRGVPGNCLGVLLRGEPLRDREALSAGHPLRRADGAASCSCRAIWPSTR